MTSEIHGLTGQMQNLLVHQNYSTTLLEKLREIIVSATVWLTIMGGVFLLPTPRTQLFP